MALGVSPVERLIEDARRAEFRREGRVSVQKEDLVTLLSWAQEAASLATSGLGSVTAGERRAELARRWKEISGT